MKRIILAKMAIVMIFGSLTLGFYCDRPPQAYSPWQDAQMRAMGTEILDPSFIPQWTPDGGYLIVATPHERGFRFNHSWILHNEPKGSIHGFPEDEAYEANIYAVDTSLTAPPQRLSDLKTHVELEYSPEISPDGTKIALITSRHLHEGNRGWGGRLGTEMRNFDIEVMDRKTGERTQITGPAHYEYALTHTYPQWLPNSRHISYLVRHGTWPPTLSNFYVTDTETGETRLLFPTAEHKPEETVRLDGRSGLPAPTRMHPPGTPIITSRPAWSPDGNHAAVVTYTAGDTGSTSELTLISRDGTEATALLREPKDYRQSQEDPIQGPITWHPDGRTIAFTRPSEDRLIHIVSVTTDGRESTLAKFEADHPAQKDRRPTRIAWSPDGKSLLISGPNYIAVIRGNTAPTVLNNAGSYASWSPDGSRIAVVNGYQGEGEDGLVRTLNLFTIKPDGTDPKIIWQAVVTPNPE